MADVFISYSHCDDQRAKWIADQLKAAGMDVWWDPKIRRGRFSEQIEAAIDKARCVVVLWSESTSSSDWVPAEADRARQGDKLVQVRLDPGCPVPLPFEWHHILELTDWDPEPSQGALQELLEAVQGEIQQSPLVKKLRRLWRPAPAPRLRPWDLWVGGVLSAGGINTLVGWALGWLIHQELALYLGAVFLVWLLWLLLRSQIRRHLARQAFVGKRVLVGVGVAGILVVAWLNGFWNLYALPPIPDDHSGIYIGRFQGDRWNRTRDRFAESLRNRIQDLGLQNELAVETLERRIRDPEAARRVLRQSEAALLMTGRVREGEDVEDSSLTFRQAPGILARRGSLAQDSVLSGARVSSTEDPEALVSAVAQFFAGYTLYQDQSWGRAETMFGAALELLSRSADAKEDLSVVGVGLGTSLRASAALFLGNCLALREDLQGALEWYDHALAWTSQYGEGDPQYIEALTNKGFVLLESGKPAPVVEALQAGKEFCRRSDRRLACALLHHNLGVAMVMTGDLEGAERELATAAARAAEVQLGLHREDEVLQIRAFIEQKRSWAAAKAAEKRLGSSPAVTVPEDLLARANEHWQLARQLWQQASDEPLPAAFRITRARLDILQGRWQEALAPLEALEAENAAVEEPEVYLLLAISRLCAGRDDSGEPLQHFLDAGQGLASGLMTFKNWSSRCANQTS